MATTRTKTPSNREPLTSSWPARVAVARWEHIPGEYLENYWNSLRRADLEPIDVMTPAFDLSKVGGLLLTGGIDIDPGLYGEAPHPEVDETNQERDALELSLLRGALERDIPVLAICRGHQLLNVAFGGSLLQHIDSREHEDEERVSTHHDATLVPGTRLHAIYERGRIHVNSRHHQAVTPDRVPEGLAISATTDDGFVEGLESHSHRWVVSVQWHPERPDPHIPGFEAEAGLLFKEFADAVRRSQ